MSDPFKEARERDERWQELQRKFDEAQRQEQEEIARANSLRQQNQEQEAKRILTAIGAREKLDYIRQSVWKCGQILDYGRLGGLSLRFDYEVLKFVRTGGYQVIGHDRGGNAHSSWMGPEQKHLKSENKTVAALNITFRADDRLVLICDGSGALMGNIWKLELPVYSSDYSSLKRQLDDHLYRYTQQVQRTPKDWIEQKNREEREHYSSYKTRSKEPR